MSSFFYVIAVDCGSESVRSCIVQYSNDSEKSKTNNCSTGKILITRKKDISILHPKLGWCTFSLFEEVLI